MRYSTPGALRAAIDQRLVTQANESGTDIARLRRRIAFERLLVRFAAPTSPSESPGKGDVWVLKGGAALEFRLSDRARATKDVDVEVRHAAPTDETVRDLLVEALLSDPDGDLFGFRLDTFGPVTVASDPGRVLRAKVECRLDGRTFDRVTVDISIGDSPHQRVEPLRLPGLLGFADLAPATILAVDLRRHFAEKLHAMLRDYGGRPSSRVKDLADLILVIDMGLEPGGDLLAATGEVFTERDGAAAPATLPDPPVGWNDRYAELASELNLSAPTVANAMDTLRNFWNITLASTKET